MKGRSPDAALMLLAPRQMESLALHPASEPILGVALSISMSSRPTAREGETDVIAQDIGTQSPTSSTPTPCTHSTDIVQVTFPMSPTEPEEQELDTPGKMGIKMLDSFNLR